MDRISLGRLVGLMKRILGFITSTVLYAVGHLISLPMVSFRWSWLYPIYDRLMATSLKIQLSSKSKGPWVVNEDLRD